jgi:hypothetical protein
MSESMEYAIKSLADLLQVPSNRRSALFADMEVWLLMAEKLNELQIGTINLDKFGWIDDGIDGLRGVNLIAPDGQTLFVDLLAKKDKP